MVEWKFRVRGDRNNGPSNDAAKALFEKDGGGWNSWTDYYPIFILRALQKNIDPQKNRIEVFVEPLPAGSDPSCFDWSSALAIRCVG
eukprot:7899279-Pyramimonas_sp.AAC.1